MYPGTIRFSSSGIEEWLIITVVDNHMICEWARFLVKSDSYYYFFLNKQIVITDLFLFEHHRLPLNMQTFIALHNLIILTER